MQHGRWMSCGLSTSKLRPSLSRPVLWWSHAPLRTWCHSCITVRYLAAYFAGIIPQSTGGPLVLLCFWTTKIRPRGQPDQNFLNWEYPREDIAKFPPTKTFKIINKSWFMIFTDSSSCRGWCQNLGCCALQHHPSMMNDMRIGQEPSEDLKRVSSQNHYHNVVIF